MKRGDERGATEVIATSHSLDCPTIAACAARSEFTVRNLGPQPETTIFRVVARSVEIDAIAGEGVTSEGEELSVALAPRAETTVTISSSLRSTARERGLAWILSAARGRHLLLSTERSDQVGELSHPAAFLEGSSAASVEWQITLPPRTALLDGDGWKVDSSDERAVAQRTFSSDETSVGPAIRFGAPEEVPRLAFGGVQIAIGSQLGAPGLRIRGGVQTAFGGWLLHTASIENEPAGVSFSSVGQVASPFALLIPSVGLGGGVVAEVGARQRLGGRLLIDAHLAFLGAVLTWDTYPGDGWTNRFTLMCQFSL